MRLRIADDGGPPAVRPHGRAFGHRLDRVVGPLAVDVRPQRLEQLGDRRRGEDDDVIDSGERGHQLGPLGRGEHGAPRSLEGGHRAVVVDRHHQPVRFRGGGGQVPHVADVDQVEAAVGERDGAALGARRVDQRPQLHMRNDPSHYPASLRPLRIAARSSPAATVAVPRFITTSPPA